MDLENSKQALLEGRDIDESASDYHPLELVQVKEHAVKLAKAMENEDGVTGALEPELTPMPSSLWSISRCFGCS
ncbi:hypothetical protein AAG906_040725 [Vitis piasezkii]